jgi:hypothetical protein
VKTDFRWRGKREAFALRASSNNRLERDMTHPDLISLQAKKKPGTMPGLSIVKLSFDQYLTGAPLQLKR